MEYAYSYVYNLIAHKLKNETGVNSAKNNGLVVNIRF